MGEGPGASGAAEIERLRQQIAGLRDADCLRPEDEGALLAAPDTALGEQAVGNMPGARAGLARFIAGAQGLVAGEFCPSRGRVRRRAILP
jgi:hypothetical protein